MDEAEDDIVECWYDESVDTFPVKGTVGEEAEHCQRVIRLLLEAESHLLKGPELKNRGMANLCCSEALIYLGHFSELRSQRIEALPEEDDTDAVYNLMWDVQTLRICAKGMATDTISDKPYDPEWKIDYRGRPPFLGPAPKVEQ